MDAEQHCKNEINRMLKNSQTKVIFPVITYSLLCEFLKTSQRIFSDREIKRLYEEGVVYLQEYMEHDLHIGAKYYDAYPARNLPRYGVLRSVGSLKYELSEMYAEAASSLSNWLPEKIKTHIAERLGVIPELGKQSFRETLSEDKSKFLQTINDHIEKNAANFEIFSFGIIKVHLEKFACKIYRDTRTSAHDRGVDLSTNFGVVYQVKKLKIVNQSAAENAYAELKMNFDKERLQDGNVILVIDDITKETKNYLINMKVQTISKDDILKMALDFKDQEDRAKVLRIVYEEFRRDYASTIK